MMNNLLENIPTSGSEEQTELLQSSQHVKIERIISKGHVTPEGEWYDQKQNEFVVVMQGRATLLFEGDDKPIALKTGDYINIPAHQRHRVEWTDPNIETIWLVVFY